MPNELTLTLSPGHAALDTFAPGVARVPVVFVNAYLVGEPGGPWVLVDTGLPGAAGRVREAAKARFGKGARPVGIVLTHGHFDHAGNAAALADEWGVPIYAHPLELPYLTGRSDYAPGDPTPGGAISFLSRFFPSSGYDFGARVRELPSDGSIPGVSDWRWIHTPGHTAGHVSLFREIDGTLLAGDALTTMDLDSWGSQVTREQEFCRPPTPLTPDWDAAEASIAELARLAPRTVGAGHGTPIHTGAAPGMAALAASVRRPPKARYSRQPALADATGIVSVPPPVADPLPVRFALGALGALALAVVLRRKR